MAGLVGDYQAQECDYVDADSSSSWTDINTGTHSYVASVADTELNAEIELAAYRVASLLSGDGIQLPYASWKDTGRYNPATPDATYEPRFGNWFRCDTGGAVITRKINYSDASSDSDTFTVAAGNSNRWTFPTELNIVAGSGKTVTNIQYYADRACVFWIARMVWVNKTRISAGFSLTVTDERIKAATPYWLQAGTASLTRCYIAPSAFLFYFSYGAETYRGMFFRSSAYSMNGIVNTTFAQSTTKNLWSGSVRNVSYYCYSWGSPVGSTTTSANWSLINMTSASALHGWTRTKTLSDIKSYNATNHFILANGYNSILSTLKISGGTSAFPFSANGLSNKMTLYNCSISSTNSPTLHISVQWNCWVDWLHDDNSIGGLLQSKCNVDAAGPNCGIDIVMAGYFIANPVTSGLRAIFVSEATSYDNDGDGNENEHPRRQLAVRATSDANGKFNVRVVVEKWTVNYTTKESYSSAAVPTRLLLINTSTNVLVANLTYDFSLGQGTSSSPVTVNLTVASTPTISTPSIAPATITQVQTALISATVTNTTKAMVMFLSGAGVPVWGREMVITAGVASCVTEPGEIPIAVYGAGQIVIIAIDASGHSATDATLALTVTAGGAPTLTDGSATVVIYSTEPEKDDIPLKIAVKEMPYKQNDAHQFLEAKNRVWTFGGWLFPDEGSQAIIAQLQTWARAGQGIKTGTLALTNDEGTFYVYISAFKEDKPPGYPPFTYIYMLELTEGLTP